MKYSSFLAGFSAALFIIQPVSAQEGHEHHNHHMPQSGLMISGDHDGVHGGNHSSHEHSQFSPIGVMGDHAHGAGDWMVSYRYMRMNMKDNRNGTHDLSPLEISGDFANVTGTGPATLRIVPTRMSMDMHMVGAMYAPTDRLTLMMMGNYIEKDMDHLTFAGGNPDLQIGEFTTRAQGFGDTKLSALYSLYQGGAHQLIAKGGISLPTGSIDKEGDILNPMGAMQRVHLPYAMQLGSGTYDFEPALTYTGHQDRLGWGVQYTGQIHLGDNDDGYSLGDKHGVSAWTGYQWNGWFQTTARVSGEYEGRIDGRDARIAGPVQTANPDNYGGKRIEAGLGFKLSGQNLALKGHDFGFEVTLPLYQDLNGPQLKRDYGLVLGYQYTF